MWRGWPGEEGCERCVDVTERRRMRLAVPHCLNLKGWRGICGQVTRMVDASATAERVKTLGKLSRVERRGAMEKCMALLEDMVRAGIEPDGVTLTVRLERGQCVSGGGRTLTRAAGRRR